MSTLYSAQQWKFTVTQKCPLCGKFLLRAKIHGADGGPLGALRMLASLAPERRAGVVATCPKCSGQWPVYAGAETANPPPAPAPAYEIRIRETGRIEEPYLDDNRDFDNREGTTSTTQTISVSEQWTQTLQLERETTSTGQIGGTIGAGKVVSLTAQVEQALRANYSLTDSRQRTFTSELAIEVPPHTRRRIELRYRRIVQTGVAEVPTADGAPLEIPFRVALNLTLDWSQHDETVAAR